MRSLRPTGRRRVRCPSQADESTSGQSERTSAGIDGVRPGSGTHPHADHLSLRSGGPSAGYVNPRCRVAGPVPTVIGVGIGIGGLQSSARCGFLGRQIKAGRQTPRKPWPSETVG